MKPFAGIVLCGGRSRRMGRPKAWLPVGSEVMLQRVVRLLSEVVSPIVVVAAPEQELPPLPDSTRITRDPEEGQGPLRGLATGLAALCPGQCEGVYLSACDVPLLQPAFVQRIIDSLGDADVCLPRVEGYLHPLAAVYRVGVRSRAEELLAAGRRRPWDLIESVRHRILEADEILDVDPEFHSLRNVNSPAEYEGILQELGLAKRTNGTSTDPPEQTEMPPDRPADA